MKLSINNLDMQLLFISAFRYALGRRSYITSTMAHIIKDNSDALRSIALSASTVA